MPIAEFPKVWPLSAVRLNAGRYNQGHAMGFLDLRQWINLLEQQGELRRIKAEVDWDREIGAVTRRVLTKKGPALLFENIKGYRDGRCTKLFVSGLGSRSRLALALGFPPDTPNRILSRTPPRRRTARRSRCSWSTRDR